MVCLLVVLAYSGWEEEEEGEDDQERVEDLTLDLELDIKEEDG